MKARHDGDGQYGQPRVDGNCERDRDIADHGRDSCFDDRLQRETESDRGGADAELKRGQRPGQPAGMLDRHRGEGVARGRQLLEARPARGNGRKLGRDKGCVGGQQQRSEQDERQDHGCCAQSRPWMAEGRTRTHAMRCSSTSVTSNSHPSAPTVSPASGICPSLVSRKPARVSYEPWPGGMANPVSSNTWSSRAHPGSRPGSWVTAVPGPPSTISPTISSRRSSSVTMPARPPYSSMTVTSWMCCDRISVISDNRSFDSGTASVSRTIEETALRLRSSGANANASSTRATPITSSELEPSTGIPV